ncbi:phage terminase small subunit P27 family [Belnapia sp. T18]|uniref:Phage terminase small subunit P27 family n=1 Tax=Belnapia arida TaxID=2804533 RepID=A0ABS1UCH0_9PROT|nr:phage terminase small subunit P27 family [Belnapia arida]MBL6082381.1 phage terminase small subunit P27 family [Belnapia arida]
MRGRKPVPTELHKLRGTLNATRHGKGRAGEPEATGDLLPEPPAWMTEAQQAGWRYALEHAPRGLLKQIDRGLLAIWVEAEARYRTAATMQAQLDQNTSLPLLTKTRDGTPVQSPYIGIMNRAAALMIKAASELGFSPAARPRLAAGAQEPAEEQSPWSQLKVIHGGKSAG